MKKGYSIVITTTTTNKLAEKIAEALVKKKLAACVQLLPIQSLYTWKKKAKKEKEITPLIKSRSDKFKEIEKLIKKLHPYEVPEIIEIKIDRGSKDYLGWISKVTS
jgi:periplasmic divalent cation tolerance protein